MTLTMSISRSVRTGNLFGDMVSLLSAETSHKFLLCVSILDVPVIQGSREHAPTLNAIYILLYRCKV